MGYKTDRKEIKNSSREGKKIHTRLQGAEGGPKNWGQGAGQREMEIAGNSRLCRKKRKELIDRDRELDREGRRKAKIAAGYRAERKN